MERTSMFKGDADVWNSSFFGVASIIPGPSTVKYAASVGTPSIACGAIVQRFVWKTERMEKDECKLIG